MSRKHLYLQNTLISRFGLDPELTEDEDIVEAVDRLADQKKAVDQWVEKVEADNARLAGELKRVQQPLFNLFVRFLGHESTDGTPDDMVRQLEQWIGAIGNALGCVEPDDDPKEFAERLAGEVERLKGELTGSYKDGYSTGYDDAEHGFAFDDTPPQPETEGVDRINSLIGAVLRKPEWPDTQEGTE